MDQVSDFVHLSKKAKYAANPVLIHLKRGSGFRFQLTQANAQSLAACLNPLETWIRFQILSRSSLFIHQYSLNPLETWIRFQIQ